MPSKKETTTVAPAIKAKTLKTKETETKEVPQAKEIKEVKPKRTPKAKKEEEVVQEDVEMSPAANKKRKAETSEPATKKPRRSDNAVFLGTFPSEVTEEQVRELIPKAFQPLITNVTIARTRGGRKMAFVDMLKLEDVEKVVIKLKGVQFEGKKLNVDVNLDAPEDKRSLLVTKAKGLTEEKLETKFSEQGHVVAVTSYDDQKFSVKFLNETLAEKALKAFNGASLEGAKLHVEQKVTKRWAKREAN